MSSPKHHALLSASSSNRWLGAPPLPRLEQYSPHTTSNVAAKDLLPTHWENIKFITCSAISLSVLLLITSLMRWKV